MLCAILLSFRLLLRALVCKLRMNLCERKTPTFLSSSYSKDTWPSQSNSSDEFSGYWAFVLCRNQTGTWWRGSCKLTFPESIATAELFSYHFLGLNEIDKIIKMIINLFPRSTSGKAPRICPLETQFCNICVHMANATRALQQVNFN